MLKRGKELAQEGASVGNNRQIGRIIAAEFSGIDVYVNEFGSGEIPRISRQPGRRGGVVEWRPDREYEIGAATRLVGRKGAVAADKAERQRIGHIDATHAVGRSDNRYGKPLPK